MTKWVMHWGDVLEIEIGMPEEPIRCDGEATQYQSADAQCDPRAALALVLEGLGPDFYGHDDGDLAMAVETADTLDDDDGEDDDGEDELGPCQCPCGCDEPAVVPGEGGPTCGACQPYAWDPGGGIVCGEMTGGFRQCHNCHEPIAWGPIETGRAPGVGSRIHGRCACAQWINLEAGGGWDEYLYRPNDDDDDDDGEGDDDDE